MSGVMTATDIDRAIAKRLGWTNLQVVGGVLFGRLNKPLGTVLEYVPQYSTNTDAALRLLDDAAFEWEMSQQTWNRLYVVCIRRALSGSNAGWLVCERAEMPALAICRAWLDWKDKQ